MSTDTAKPTIVSPKQAYEWVKTGHWDYTRFSAWVSHSRTAVDDAFNYGYHAGYDNGYESGCRDMEVNND